MSILLRPNGRYADTYAHDRPGRQPTRRPKRDAPSVSLGAFKFRDVVSGDIFSYNDVQSASPFGVALLASRKFKGDVTVGTILSVRAPDGWFEYEILKIG